MCISMWRDLIPELLTSGEYRTQAELVDALCERGHVVNQATVSRELANLRVRKVDGIYRLAAASAPGLPIHAFLDTARGCLVVVRTDPAFAMALAQTIDGADLEGVLGTVAGDDTVFVATNGTEGVANLAEYLGIRPGTHPPKSLHGGAPATR